MTIVLVGAFNPRIFHPSWFGKHNLLREEEVDVATTAREVVVTPDLTIFNSGWFPHVPG